MLVADGASLTLAAVGAGLSSGSSDGNGTLTVGALGYLFAPAVIHIAHGRVGMAPASVGVRLFVPLAGLLLGSGTEGCRSPGDSEFCSGTLPGLLVGLAVASALDAGLFSWDKPNREAAAKPEFGLSPVLSRDGKRAELRAFGTF